MINVNNSPTRNRKKGGVMQHSYAGVSAKNQYDVNSLAVPRKAKEAIGGIARLKHKDGHCMTINVEYNQLDPLLRAVGDGQGDVNDDSGWSPYPGLCSPVTAALLTLASS